MNYDYEYASQIKQTSVLMNASLFCHPLFENYSHIGHETESFGMNFPSAGRYPTTTASAGTTPCKLADSNVCWWQLSFWKLTGWKLIPYERGRFTAFWLRPLPPPPPPPIMLCSSCPIRILSEFGAWIEWPPISNFVFLSKERQPKC